MKTKNALRLGLLLFCSSILLIASCKKKDDNSGNDNPSDDPGETFDNGSVSMKVNGSSWTGNDEENYILVSDELFSILASNDNSSITLYGQPFSGEGSYPFAGSPRFGLFYDIENFTSYMDTANGSITVSNYDAIEHRLSGSFNLNGFVLSDPLQNVQITEGEITNVPIRFQKVQDPSVISFKIDGSNSNVTNASSSTLPEYHSLVISYESTTEDYYGDLAFPYTLDPGTYNYNLNQPGFIRFWYKFMLPTSGSLTITVNDKVNHHVEGNFHCAMHSSLTMESANITEGVFSIDY